MSGLACSSVPGATDRTPATKDSEAIVRCYSGKGVGFEAQPLDRMSAKNAGMLALFSEAAYAPHDAAISAAHMLGFKRAELFSLAKLERAKTIEKRLELVVADSQVLVAESDDVVVVSFRGSEPTVLTDWLTDLDFFREAMGPGGVQGRVHGGFYRAEAIIHDQIMDWLKGVTGVKPMYVTGHSLGAALGTVFAARYMADYDRFVNRKQNDIDFTDLWTMPYFQGMYNYGSPRVGDSNFVTIFEFLVNRAKIMPFETADGSMIKPAGYVARFVADQDIVTRVPGSGEFKHIRNLKYLDSAGRLYEDARAEAIVNDSVWRLPVERLLDWGLDHMMGKTYQEQVFRLTHSEPSGCP